MTSTPVPLADRIDTAERLARCGCTVRSIVEACGLPHETADAIHGRCAPQLRDPFQHAGLKRTQLTDEQHAQRLANMGRG